jgi:cation diffusion facilitator family transporter
MMKNEKQSVAMSSMLASAALTAGKLVVGFSTGSLGIVSEGLHSFMDFGATVLTFMAVRISDKPADPGHPYGHGKIENVAALAETALLFLTSAWIIFEAVKRLVSGHSSVEATWWSAGVIIASILIDIWRARELKRVAEKTKSQALEADALHFSSDVLSSCVVLVGIGFVSLGFPIGDPISAIGVSVFVCHAGWALGRRTIDTLIDTAPLGASERVSQSARRVRGVAGVKRVRVRPVGSVSFVDIEVYVGRGLSLFEVAEIKTKVIAAIHREMPDAEVLVSTAPLALDDETIQERVMIVAHSHGAAVHHVTIHRSQGRMSVGFDLEVNAHSSVREAHEAASRLEADLRVEFGADTEVESHVEPFQESGFLGEDVGDVERSLLADFLGNCARESGYFSNVHGVRARKTDRGRIVIFHCEADPQKTVGEVHTAMDAIERKVRQSDPSTWRIVAHIEPRGQ